MNKKMRQLSLYTDLQFERIINKEIKELDNVNDKKMIESKMVILANCLIDKVMDDHKKRLNK